ncbi:MAG: thymidine phosphorylase, partial [Myxococcales bacterium]|nr:thymidine phosphorylase [Myxococcales bacterium]
MQAYEIIIKKRDKQELSGDELRWFVEGYTKGTVPDYQVASFLMAVFLNGMTSRELEHWTGAMLNSGEVLDLSSIPGFKVDKHSTGGVGDKVSLPLAPLVAAAGAPVPMISGRGLGHTGGTLDKLESIPGMRTDLTVERFREMVGTIGCSLIGQTAEIAPADKKLYALRDVTGTVECIPLIASSIMSKKLAEGIDGLVLDVKVGSGAFMKSMNQAVELARTMIGIGEAMDTRVVALITSMDEPLGMAVGNAVEVAESIQTLKGNGPDDLLDVTLALGAEMLLMAGIVDSSDAGIARLQKVIDSGEGLRKFQEIVEAQGGDPRAIEDESRLPQPTYRHHVLAPVDGVVQRLDALAVGK